MCIVCEIHSVYIKTTADEDVIKQIISDYKIIDSWNVCVCVCRSNKHFFTWKSPHSFRIACNSVLFHFDVQWNGFWCDRAFGNAFFSSFFVCCVAFSRAISCVLWFFQSVLCDSRWLNKFFSSPSHLFSFCSRSFHLSKCWHVSMMMCVVCRLFGSSSTIWRRRTQQLRRWVYCYHWIIA